MSNEPTKTAVPKLRFPEFREAGEWEEMKLGKIGKIITGKTPSTQNAEFWGGSILFITPTDISENNKYQTQTQRTVSNNTIVKILPVGSIVYTCIASIGKIAITTEDSCTNQQINSIFVNKNIDNEFIYYSLINLTPYIKSKTAISTLPIINKSEFSSFEVILPEFAEQQKIAACLSSLDDLLTAQTAKLAALQAHKRGLLQGLFPAAGETVPKLRFPEFREAEEWEEKLIGNICKTFSGGTPSTSQKDYYGGNIPFIRSAEIDRGITELFLTVKGLKNSSAKLVDKGDILFALYGANSGEVAICKQQGAINQAILCLRSEYSNAFIFYFLLHKQDWIIKKYIQGGQGNLSGEIVRSIDILLPKLAEQQKIAACLSSLDDRISAQTAQLAALQLHKKGLMQGLFPTTPEATA